MRFYENPEFLHENRLPQRSYYIPKNDGAYMLLNGEWKFKYFEFDDEGGFYSELTKGRSQSGTVFL